MRITERLLFLLIGLGFTMDAFDLPFAGMVYTAGFAALALFYFLGSARLLSAPGGKQQLLPLSLLGGAALGCSVLALLFKVQLWPGAAHLALVAAALGGACIAFGLHYGERRPQLAPYFSRAFRRLAPAFAVALFLLVRSHWQA